MTPITRQDILAHQAVVPWAAQYQVEQDLLLCRAMLALFDDSFLNSQIAMRGGTWSGFVRFVLGVDHITDAR